MIVIAGPNGSGKSTFVKISKNSPGFPDLLINRDEILKLLKGKIADAQMLGPIADILERECLRWAWRASRSFVYETGLSSPERLAMLQEYKASNFRMELVFLTTSDPRINLERVATRVAQGGHDIGADTLRRRYEVTMGLLPSALELADTAYV
jgi:predicted ABC-type ATPase